MKRLRAALLLSALLFPASAGTALAHGASGESQLPDDAPAVTPEGAKAKKEIQALEGREAGLKRVIGSALAAAKKALGRAHGASLAGDTDGARILSRVSLSWAKAAGAIARATETEKRADDGQAKVKDLRDKVERAKALRTETESRKRQLTTEIARAELTAKQASGASIDAEKKRIEKTEPKKKKEKTQ
jgi:hypothetical protein